MKSVVVSRRCVVSGRVQGVYYRASTRQQAALLGLHGYARNLDDGRVEIIVVGAESAIQQLVDWLWKGPPAARVDDVEITDATLERVPEQFTVL